jgi:hypothetical protein
MLNPLNMTNPLFWTHPEGDTTKVPCTHIVRKEETIPIPIPYWEPEHPGGHSISIEVPGPNPSVTVPCLHMAWKTKNQDIKIPYFVPEHPEGDPGPTIPCIHPLPIVRFVDELWLVFYTDDTFIQEETIKAVRKLSDLGVMMSSPIRPLNVFHRPFLRGYPEDSSNPFWSHYDPITHSIQITKRNVSQDSLRDTIHHELGHATLGHRIVQVTTPGGQHSITQLSSPSLAMSEGWAHFVALAIRFSQADIPSSSSSFSYKGENWEYRNPNVPMSPNIEYNVACTLWDCFDVGGDSRILRLPDGRIVYGLPQETANLPFSELYRVFSPTLATVPFGPLIPNLDDYLERLIANNPQQAARIQAARKLNCGFATKAAFKTNNGKYLVSMGGQVFATSIQAGTLETFIVEKANLGDLMSGDTVNIKAHNGKYLVAENGGGSVLNANRELPYQWEQFVIERQAGSGLVQNGDQVALRGCNNQYVCAEDGGGQEVKANRDNRDIWETFTIAIL